jgi:hypothetical protein
MLLGAFVVPGSAAAGDNGLLHRCGYPGYYMSQATIELPPGYWAEGDHYSSIRFVAGSSGIDETWGPFEFTVSDSAALYSGQVVVAAGVISAGWIPIPDQTINPAQDTVLWAGWAFGPGDFPSMPAAYEFLDDLDVLFAWDGGEAVLAREGPWTSTCATIWLSSFHRSFGPVVEP